MAQRYRHLHCVRTRRKLHSFPTRRSSDLVKPCATLRRKIRLACPGPAWEWMLCWNAPAYLQKGRIWKNMFKLEPSMSSLDRKSTRLNSSHLVISYAVFCLKKKKSVQEKTI